ncbi:hypothetical protein CEXT_66451 [Caerostris extrusa]|uniref:C2H2-type domain-containing protein n=1 Tax=Caerostris extrusa TaxID=172846 RepID=A0AAV4THL9_CAEEX|nr:hypothetical protein CEXT_66451 [Caerostris extrusa]
MKCHIKWKHPEYVTPKLGRSSMPNIAIPNPSKPTQEQLSFSCNFCKKSFKSIADLRSHLINHRIKYLCHFCLKTFANHEECNRHFKTSHPSVHKRINSIDESGMKWSSDDEKSCEVIPKAAPDSFGSFACMICLRKVTTVKNLQQHFTRHLSKVKDPEVCPPDDGSPLLQVLLG